MCEDGKGKSVIMTYELNVLYSCFTNNFLLAYWYKSRNNDTCHNTIISSTKYIRKWWLIWKYHVYHNQTHKEIKETPLITILWKHSSSGPELFPQNGIPKQIWWMLKLYWRTDAYYFFPYLLPVILTFNNL